MVMGLMSSLKESLAPVHAGSQHWGWFGNPMAFKPLQPPVSSQSCAIRTAWGCSLCIL